MDIGDIYNKLFTSSQDGKLIPSNGDFIIKILDYIENNTVRFGDLFFTI